MDCRTNDPWLSDIALGAVLSHGCNVVFRARGTELISPEDLIDAAKLLSTFQLGMRLRTFKSGVSVIEAGKE